MTTRQIIEGIPSYLEVPAETAPQPPVNTLQQVLPCQDLTWENFERLCVRVARLETHIERTQLYGVLGQAQQGIDLFARSSEGNYRVYQCKNVDQLSAADLRGAVDKFLEGTWATRVTRFVFCTTHNSVKTQLAEEYVRQQQRLQERNIDFDLYDREELSFILKSHPTLVHDFFGKAWVESFNGPEASHALAARLDPSSVGLFRKKLRAFYAAVFEEQDAIIPLPALPGVDNIPLEERFVVPDLLIDTSLTVNISGPSRPETSPQQLDDRLDSRTPARKAHAENEMVRRGTYQTRQALETWIAKEKHSLIIGGPGAGKSALLRYLALNIVADHPPYQLMAAKWGDKLPVWIPFAFWTKLIAETGQSAITECIKQWLGSWSKEELWPVVERALNDERLLLLVDGLDEWTNAEAANIAIQRLQVFIKTNKVQVLATSRPYSGLSIHGTEWQAGEIAPLSDAQQLKLIRLWFSLRNRAQLSRGQSGTTDVVIDEHSKSFFQQLSESRDLDELAGIPLLLLLLIFLRFQNAELPRDRFSAYREVIDYLIKRHPAIKRASALITLQRSAKLHERDIQSVLCRVAYEIQINFPAGVIDESTLLQVIENYLNDPDGVGLELSKPGLREYAEAFTSSIEGASGLLVRQGLNSFSLLHRSIQEFLTALYISRKNLEYQRDIYKSRLNDPRWREVLLAVLWLLERPEEVATIIKDLRNDINNSYTGFLTRELLAESVFGEIRCPGALAREISSEILNHIAEGEWIAHRKRLLRFSLNGLNSHRTRDLVRERLERWAFRPASWSPAWYSPLTQWPPNDELKRILLIALGDEEIQVQQEVAKVISNRYGGNASVGDELAKRAERALDINHRANSLIALASGWPSYPNLDNLILTARGSQSAELVLAGIQSLVTRKKAGDSELDDLVKLGAGRFASGLDYSWHSLITRTLIEGWSGNERLKASCLASLEQQVQGEGQLHGEIALSVLLQGFSNDAEVVSYCIDEIRQTNVSPFLFLHLEAWQLLSANFEGNTELGNVADSWLEKQQHRTAEVALAALIGKSAIGKKKLIELLNDHLAFWPAGSLLKGWGRNDSEVANALHAAAYGDPDIASSFADLLPEIIQDQREARRRLMELLEDSAASWKDRILEGLALLPDRVDEQEIVDISLKVRPGIVGFHSNSFDSALIQGFPNFASIRKLAKDRLEGHYPLIGTVASAYSGDEEMRDLVSKRLTALPIPLRIEAIQRMSRNVGDDFTLDLLRRYDTESNDEAKCLASIAFHNRLIKEGTNIPVELETLSKMIEAYGPDFEQRRRAAFAGLLILGRLDLMNKLESIGEANLLSISLGSYFHPNLPLIRLIAEKWEAVKAAFGSDIGKRLTRMADLPFPRALAEVAAEFPDLQKDLWQYVEEREIGENPTFLRLFATVYPKSEALKMHCLEALRRDDQTWGGYAKLATAADILAEQFGGDQEVLERVLRQSAPSNLSTGQILTIATGWPESKLLQEVYELMMNKRINENSPVKIFEVLYTRIPAEKFINHLLKHLNRIPQNNNYFSNALLRPVLRRVKNDLMIREIIADYLLTTRNSNAKATLCKVLANAGTLLPDVKTWVEKEIQMQLEGPEPPEIGFDLFQSKNQSVVLSLLDSI